MLRVLRFCSFNKESNINVIIDRLEMLIFFFYYEKNFYLFICFVNVYEIFIICKEIFEFMYL